METFYPIISADNFLFVCAWIFFGFILFDCPMTAIKKLKIPIYLIFSVYLTGFFNTRLDNSPRNNSKELLSSVLFEFLRG